MLTRKYARFIPAFLAVAAGGLLLTACGGHHCGWRSSPEERAEKVVGRISKELDLTESQEARLGNIKDDILARKAEFRALGDGLHQDFLAQLRAGSVDTAALNRNLEEREAKLRELRAFLVGKFAEFNAVLEPAQREKLAAHIEDRHRKHGRRHGG